MARNPNNRSVGGTGGVLSHRGQPVNIAALRSANPKMLSAGNASVNARGDQVDKNGKIVRTREEISADYYSKNPKAVPVATALNQPVQEMLNTKPVAQPVTFANTVVQSTVQQPTAQPKNDLDHLKQYDVGKVIVDPLADETTGFAQPKAPVVTTPVTSSVVEPAVAAPEAKKETAEVKPEEKKE